MTILGSLGTRLAVEAKWGTGTTFDRPAFYQQCELYLRNDKFIVDRLLTHTTKELARLLIYRVVEYEAVDQSGDEWLKPSTAGIINGMGGHRYHSPVFERVQRMVEAEKQKHVV